MGHQQIKMEESEVANSLGNKIKEAGDSVRELKLKKADKAAIDSAVKELLALKIEFKAANGVDWVPEGGAPAPRSSKTKKTDKEEKKKEEPKKMEEKDESSGLKKQTRL